MDLTLSMLDLDGRRLSKCKAQGRRLEHLRCAARKALHGVGCVWSLDVF